MARKAMMTKNLYNEMKRAIGDVQEWRWWWRAAHLGRQQAAKARTEGDLAERPGEGRGKVQCGLNSYHTVRL